MKIKIKNKKICLTFQLNNIFEIKIMSLEYSFIICSVYISFLSFVFFGGNTSLSYPLLEFLPNLILIWV